MRTDALGDPPEVQAVSGKRGDGRIWIVLGLLNVGAVLLFCGFAAIFDAHHRLTISSVLVFLFAVSATAALAGFMFRRWQNRFVVCCCYLVMALVLGSIIFACSSEARPGLTLVLSTSESPGNDLLFTNSFLDPPDPNKIWAATSLVIPVQAGHSNVVLRFRVFNSAGSSSDYRPDSSMTAESAELTLMIWKSQPAGSLTWAADSAWEKPALSRGSGSAVQLTHHIQKPLLPMANEPAPEISFAVSENTEESALVHASIRAKNSTTKTVVFKVEFLRIGAFGRSDSYFRANNVNNTKLISTDDKIF